MNSIHPKSENARRMPVRSRLALTSCALWILTGGTNGRAATKPEERRAPVPTAFGVPIHESLRHLIHSRI